MLSKWEIASFQMFGIGTSYLAAYTREEVC